MEISNDLKMYGRIAQEFEDSVEQHNIGRINIVEAGSHYEFHLSMLMKLGDNVKDWRKPYYHELIEVLKARILEKRRELDGEYIKSGRRVV